MMFFTKNHKKSPISRNDSKRHRKVQNLVRLRHISILKNLPTPSVHHVVTQGHGDRKNGLYKFWPPEDSINSVTSSTMKKPTSKTSKRQHKSNTKLHLRISFNSAVASKVMPHKLANPAVHGFKN